MKEFDCETCKRKEKNIKKKNMFKYTRKQYYFSRPNRVNSIFNSVHPFRCIENKAGQKSLSPRALGETASDTKSVGCFRRELA